MTQRQSFDSFSNSNHGIPSNMFSWSTLQLWIGIIISQISHNLGRNHVIETARYGIVTHRLWEENLGNVTEVIVTDSFGFVAQSLWFCCPNFIPKEKIVIENYSFLR